MPASRRMLVSVLAVAAVLSGGAGATRAQTATTQAIPAAARANPALWPAAASPAAITDARTEAFIGDLMARMTLEEKVGQIIQADIASITPADLAVYPIGSILRGGTLRPAEMNGRRWRLGSPCRGPSARPPQNGRARRFR